MPRIIELKWPDGSIYQIVSTIDDIIEKESPAIWFGAYAFFKLTHLHGLPKEKARELSLIMLKEWVKTPCPEFLLRLIDSTSKKEQERLLRGKSITPENLICWILQGGRRGGLFSQYSYDAGAPKEFEGRIPLMIDASDKKHIKTIGKTDLSDAALMYLVENQKRVIAQFLDFPDSRWLCFYRTFRGLSGRESGGQGQHLHFISSAYNCNRESLVAGFKQGICPSNGFHIHLCGYWDDTNGGSG